MRRASWSFLEPWEPAPAKGVSPFGPKWLEGFLAGARRRDCERFLLCLEETGAIVGQLGLSNIVRGVFHSAYLGYWIGAAYARRGLMGEGVALVLDEAFGPLGLHRVEANIRPENLPSRALVERAGFRLEGYSPQYLRIAGEWCDHERWALLADEWSAGVRPGSGRAGARKVRGSRTRRRR